VQRNKENLKLALKFLFFIFQMLINNFS